MLELDAACKAVTRAQEKCEKWVRRIGGTGEAYGTAYTGVLRGQRRAGRWPVVCVVWWTLGGEVATRVLTLQ